MKIENFSERRENGYFGKSEIILTLNFDFATEILFSPLRFNLMWDKLWNEVACA